MFGDIIIIIGDNNLRNKLKKKKTSEATNSCLPTAAAP